MSTAAAIVPVSVSGPAPAARGENVRGTSTPADVSRKADSQVSLPEPIPVAEENSQTPATPPSSSHIQESIQKFLKTQNTILSFERDEGTDQVIVKILDPETKEVLRQYPPDEILKLAQAMDKAQGNMVDERI